MTAMDKSKSASRASGKDKADDSLSIKLTRRGFLGSASAAAATPAFSAFAADNLVYLAPEEDGFSISFGGVTWICKLVWFGANSSHDLGGPIKILPDGKPVNITIQKVRFPGSTLGFDLKFRVRFVEGRAGIALSIPSLGIEDEIDLNDWLHTDKVFNCELSAKKTASITAALEPKSITATGPATLAFFREGAFALITADKPFILKLNGISAEVSLLRFAIGAAAAPPGFSASDVLSKRPGITPNYTNNANVTVLWAQAPNINWRPGEIGHTAKVVADLSEFTVVRPVPGGSNPSISVLLSNLSASSRAAVVVKCFKFGCRVAFSAKNKSESQDVEAWPDFKIVSSELIQVSWERNSRTLLTGSFNSKPRYVAKGHVPLAISGKDGDGFVLECVDNEITRFSAEAQLHHAFVPMKGADYSRIDFEETEVRYALKDLAPGENTSRVAAGYMLAFPPVFSAVLCERAIIRVTRAADLIALKYSFRDIFLAAEPGNVVLDSCERCLPGFKLAPGRSPMMIVRFPPQHIAEKAYLRVTSDSVAKQPHEKVPLQKQRIYESKVGSDYGEIVNVVDKLRSGDRQALEKNIELARKDRDPDLEAKQLLEALDHVVEARMAGPTRLVFSFDPISPQARQKVHEAQLLPRPFSIGALTDWDGLTAKVAARALPGNASLVEQLRVSGITELTPIVDKTHVIDRSLTAPNSENTAIEFPYRLQLSPSDDARWITPPELTEERMRAGIPLWTVQLDPKMGGKNVRALWSPDFDAARTLFFFEKAHPPHSNKRPWQRERKSLSNAIRNWFSSSDTKMRMSLDARDRHELVVLSSIYGLPALLPVPDPNILRNQNGDGDDQHAEATVFPLPKGFPQSVNKVLGKEGVYNPRPMTGAQIALSSLGATVDLQGQWEPPSGFTLDGEHKPLWPALTIERWRHKAFLGRDVFVEVVYKGFLFPLGHRCAVLKASERKLLADPRDNSCKAPVAYLIQRYFVVVGQPRKSFPAIGQRFAGRALYATSVTILTTKSPDIVDPFANAISPSFGSMGGTAFFPKTSTGNTLDGAVQFEYQIDYSDKAARKLKGPLIVIDNTLAHDPEGIEQLIKYYNSLHGPGRMAEAGGQRLRYAEERAAGSTEFVTRDWLLGAVGRDVDPKAIDPNLPPIQFEYTMDAAMEGADQPPFYPVCAEARIEVQSLNYMNGKSQGYVTAGYDLNYLRYGFSGAKNPSGIFLALLERDGKRTHLSLDENTAASGGLATPNMKAVAISREKGPVGGTQPPEDLSRRLTESTRLTPSTENVPNLSLAQQGQFDGAEALAGALNLPKLFGTIPLQSLVPVLSFIEGAPEAIESTTYTITDQLAEFGAKARQVVQRIREAVEGATNELDQSLAALALKLGLSQPIRINDLYPRLSGAFKQLSVALERLESAAGNFDPADPVKARETFGALSAIVAAIKSTLAEIKAVVQHPAPNLENFIAQINVALKAVGDGLRSATRDEIKRIVDEIAEALSFTVVFRRRLRPNGTPYVEMIVGETTKEISDIEAEPLYQFMVVALVGRPDKSSLTEAHPELKLTFDIKNYAATGAQGANGAASAVADQLLSEALLYDSISKPLVSGYVLLNQLATTFVTRTADFDAQLHDLPKQLTTVLGSWLEGVLGFERLFGLSRAFDRNKIETILKAALESYVDPLVVLPSVKVPEAAIDAEMAKVLEAIDALNLDPNLPPRTKAAIGQGRIKLAKLRLRLKSTLDDYESLRGQLPKPSALVPSGSSVDFDKVRTAIAGALGKLFASQLAVLISLNDTIAASLGAIASFPDDTLSTAGWQALLGLAKVEQASVDLVNQLVPNIVPFAPMPVELQNVFQMFDVYDEVISTSNNVVSTATDLRKLASDAKVSTLNDVADIKKLSDRGQKFLNDAGNVVALLGADQRALAGLATRGLILSAQALSDVDATTYAKLKPAIMKALALLNSNTGVPGIYQIAETVRKSIDPKSWCDEETQKILALFLNKNMFKALTALSEGGNVSATLKKEREQVELVQTSVINSVNFGNLDHKAVSDLLRTSRSWSANNLPGPALVLQPIQQSADLLLKGKLADMVDLNGLASALEDSLLAFIPAQVSFDYDWSVPLKPFPSETTKLFWIDQKAKAERPKPSFKVSTAFKDKTRKSTDDLAIYVRAGVDLSNPKRPKPLLQAEADIRFCHMNLFGPSFNVVTVKFEQIRFSVDEKGSDFHVQLAKKDPVEFGPMVEYIKKLASAFLGDSGLYLRPAASPLGIEAGFGYGKDRISLGSLSLLNFAIDISLRLSFDNTPVSLSCSIASRDKPLTIVSFPYGGVGHLALRTIASDIVGFEMLLAFGGAVAISFGPLNAHGFVGAGIYIEKQKGQALILEGFVRAIGEGNIACFSICVFFELRIHQEESNVTGQLTVVVSFKAGFFKLTYSYTAHYTFSGRSEDSAGFLEAKSAEEQRCDSKERVHINVANRNDDWKKYRSYFAH
jgi:hypothetical protein